MHNNSFYNGVRALELEEVLKNDKI